MADMPVLADATIPELPNHYKGKVRENYDLPGDRRVIIATDRLSAFDRILTCIPYKGQILTQIARYWFDKTGDICPNHVIDYPDPNVVIGKRPCLNSAASASLHFTLMGSGMPGG